LGKPNHAAGGSGVVNHIRIQRIGNRIAAFSRANRIPISHRNLPIVAAARDCRRAAVLLRSINPVRETVIGGDSVKFPGGLVVPWTPSLAAVHADGCALVCPQNHPLWIRRIDPHGVVIVSAGGDYHTMWIDPTNPQRMIL